MKRLSLLTALAWLVLGYVAIAGENAWWSQVGYRYVSGIDYEYSHDTHPDDRWLPNGDVPGSAGTTHVSEAHVIEFGVGRDFALPKSFVAWASFDLGIGVNMDNHQNDNDYRDAACGAFVFSWPLLLTDAGVGVGYDFGPVMVGAEVRAGGLLILSGYDRYSALDPQSADWEWLVGGGPKVVVRLGEDIALEGRALFGNATSASIDIVYRF